MRFEAIGLDGAWLVHQEAMQDERGFFARTFCVNEFGRSLSRNEIPAAQCVPLVPQRDGARDALPGKRLTRK